VRGALSKGVRLLKMPSNDMITASALLRTMADVDPDHPPTRSFSAAYWRGGDETIEGHIYRSQNYNKLAVWGGDAAVRHAMKYAAPGFEIISFDPKVSIGLIGVRRTRMRRPWPMWPPALRPMCWPSARMPAPAPASSSW
jgi:hypothetical protein